MTPFECYKSYLALKSHFTRDSYDYFKYGGKVRAKQSSFDTRRDRYYFEKLAKRPDCTEFMLANLLEDPEIWIGTLVKDDSHEEVFTKWKKRNQSLTYLFTEEIKKLDEPFDANFRAEAGRHPNVIKLALRREISIETLVILLHLTGSYNYLNTLMNGDPVWSGLALKIKKYQPFMKYDIENFRKIAMKVLA